MICGIFEILSSYTQHKVVVYERPLSKQCLDETDVFILDLGERVVQVK